MCDTYGTHERVEHADRERRTTSKRLRHVEFSARVVVVVLVQKLYIGVIACIINQSINQREICRAPLYDSSRTASNSQL